MKNITLKLSIFSMILLSTILFSCKEEPPVRSVGEFYQNLTTNITYTGYIDSVNMVGLQHNEFLDSIHNKLLLIKNGEEQQPQLTLNEFLFDEIISFANLKNYDFNLIDSTQLFLLDSFNLNQFLNTYTDLTPLSMSILSSLDSIIIELTLDNISLSQFNQFCNSKINVAFNIDSVFEKYYVGSVLSVSKHSANYWNDNYEKWVELGNIEESINFLNGNVTNANKIKNKNKNNILKLQALNNNAKYILTKDIGGAFGAVSIVGTAYKANPAILAATGLQGAVCIFLGSALVGAGSNSLKGAIGIACGGLPWWLDF